MISTWSTNIVQQGSEYYCAIRKERYVRANHQHMGKSADGTGSDVHNEKNGRQAATIHLHSSGSSTTLLRAWHPPSTTSCKGSRPSDPVLSGSGDLDHARGHRHASWLRQVESYLKEMDMMGTAFAWTMVRRRPRWPDGG